MIFVNTGKEIQILFESLLGKAIKRYECTNFGKNIHIDKSPGIVYYKHIEKTI